MKKGGALDDDRLKNLGGGNYFDELLARIRDIRSSEKYFGEKFWKYMQQVLIMTQKQNVRLYFSSRYKIKCTGRLISTQRQK